MTRKKYCATVRSPPPPILPAREPHSERTFAAYIINRVGLRLFVCVALLGTVVSCGSRWGLSPTQAMPADAALIQAMALEKVSTSWNDSLRFLMEKESGGRVGTQNSTSSARGLFQLTSANYNLNPNGAASFGNAVEEAQGGIRYIKQRYGTAEHAVTHWNENHWY